MIFVIFYLHLSFIVTFCLVKVFGSFGCVFLESGGNDDEKRADLVQPVHQAALSKPPVMIDADYYHV